MTLLVGLLQGRRAKRTLAEQDAYGLTRQEEVLQSVHQEGNKTPV